MTKKPSRRSAELLVLAAFIALGTAVVLRGMPSSETADNGAEPKPARFWSMLPGNAVQCELCFRNCIIAEGERGYCRVRENRAGRLYTLVYGRPAGFDLATVEKEPLYHVLPGHRNLGVFTAGCNFRCSFCHNWHVATKSPEEVRSLRLSPEELVDKARENGVRSISFTINEPTVFYEYMYETAALAREQGLLTLFHTNGAMNPEPLRQLLRHMDAVCVDLKGFTAEFFSKTSFSQLDPVLETLEVVKESGVWFEIVNLLIPTLNDDPEQTREMCRWIKENLGADVPVHFNRFFPAYRLTRLPPTPVETLERARAIALDEGLRYVTIGNVPGHEFNSTYCPECGATLVRRVHFSVLENNIEDGSCGSCGHQIPGLWSLNGTRR